MKAVILCGGKGSRIESDLPKPLVPIGGRAMLHRVMDWYFSQGVSEFVLALGHRGDEIAAASGYDSHWTVRFEDTGPVDEVGKAGRLKRLSHLLREPFFLGYCDDLSDVRMGDLAALRDHADALVTMAVAQRRLPWGAAELRGDEVIAFEEKPWVDSWANLGRYCLHPRALEMIRAEREDFEESVLPHLVMTGRVRALIHRGRWLQINTAGELAHANELHAAGRLAHLAS